jgi:hypothetical protein
MDKFLHRLKYYGFGFGIGIVFVFFFFQNRGCTWLPANRVKNSILERVIVIPEVQLVLMKKNGNLDKKILRYLNEGDVNFSESDKSGPDKRYIIGCEDLPDLYFTLPDESFISAVYMVPTKDVADRKGKALIKHYPKDDHLFFVDSTDQMPCKLSKLGYKNEIELQKGVAKSAYLDFDKCVFSEVAKPLHYIETKDGFGKPMAFKAIWYKNKINVVGLYTHKPVDCL